MTKCAFAALLCLPVVLAQADTLQPLGDEFDNAASLDRWHDLGVVEGWVTPSFEAADINTTTPGHFRIVPGALSWYNHLRGLLFFKEVSGDFVATTRLRVFSRHNPANPLRVPNRSFSLTGLFAHAPRPIVRAAPDPYTTTAVWPPAAFGSDYVPDTENYIFLSFGTAGNPGTRQFEIKATRHSDSRLYFSSNGVPQGTANEVWLQMVRVGNTVVCLRKHDQAGPWIVENRYPNPDHPFPDFGRSLQLGLTAYTDWDTAAPFSNGGVATSYHFNYAPPNTGSPDLVSEVDYFRLQRPAAPLTEAVLQGMAVSYNPATSQTANPPVPLSASPTAAPHLGDHADVPLGTVAFGAASFSAAEHDGALIVSVIRSGPSLDQPLSVAYQTTPDTATTADFATTVGFLTWAPDDPPEKTLSIPLINDGLPEGTESFSVTLSALDGPATFAASTPTLSLPLVIHDHPFDQWRVDRFGLADAQGPDAAPNADADHDGLDTLIEYVFDTDPLLASDTAALSATVTQNDRIGLQFTPAAMTPGVQLVVESSTALGHWQPLASRLPGATSWTIDTPGSEASPGPAAGEIFILSPVSDQPRLFFRLRAVAE